jgi:hypothetical protein
MSPILGIVASQNYVRTPPSSYESIATATGTGSSGTITFSSIPSTYQHLQLRCIFLSGGDGNVRMAFNGTTGSSTDYSYHQLRGNGTSATSGGNYDSFRIEPVGFEPSTGVGCSIIDIHDYANTSKNKTSRHFVGYDTNGTGSIYLSSGLWRSTNAITSITFTAGSGSNFSTSTQISLYGVK